MTRQTRWPAVLALAVFSLGCHGGDVPAHAADAKPVAHFAACLHPGAAPASCPGFLVDATRDAATQCHQLGGNLTATGKDGLTTRDVDGDGKPEYLFDMSAGLTCEGAASAFSCGSLGCPTPLYRQHDGKWALIGEISAEDVPGLEVLRPPGGKGFAMLRGGCAGQPGCNTLHRYTWNGHEYRMTQVEVGSHTVTPTSGRLVKLTHEVPVLAEPAANARVLHSYGPGSFFAIIGKADGTDYLYVSPCNACDPGFVRASTLRR